jgi:hypothetical protein
MNVLERLFSDPPSAYMTICAVVLFNVGAWVFLKRLRLCLGGRAEGEIVGYTERMRSHRSAPPMYMPRIRYWSLQHGQCEFQSRMGASPKRWPVGTRVSVAYSETDPSVAEIATPARLWLAPAIFWMFAAVVIVAAAK